MKHGWKRIHLAFRTLNSIEYTWPAPTTNFSLTPRSERGESWISTCRARSVSDIVACTLLSKVILRIFHWRHWRRHGNPIQPMSSRRYKGWIQGPKIDGESLSYCILWFAGDAMYLTITTHFSWEPLAMPSKTNITNVVEKVQRFKDQESMVSHSIMIYFDSLETQCIIIMGYIASWVTTGQSSI